MTDGEITTGMTEMTEMTGIVEITGTTGTTEIMEIIGITETIGTAVPAVPIVKDMPMVSGLVMRRALKMVPVPAETPGMITESGLIMIIPVGVITNL